MLGRVRREQHSVSIVDTPRTTAKTFIRSNTTKPQHHQSDRKCENVSTYISKQWEKSFGMQTKGLAWMCHLLSCGLQVDVSQGNSTYVTTQHYQLAQSHCEARKTIITDISEIMEINCRQKTRKWNAGIQDATSRLRQPQYVSVQVLQKETLTCSENSFAFRTPDSK